MARMMHSSRVTIAMKIAGSPYENSGTSRGQGSALPILENADYRLGIVTSMSIKCSVNAETYPVINRLRE